MSRPSGPDFNARPWIHTIADAELRSGLNLVLTVARATMVAAIEARVLALATTRDLVSEFHRVVRAKTPALLQVWTRHVVACMLASVGCDIAADPAARVGCRIGDAKASIW